MKEKKLDTKSIVPALKASLAKARHYSLPAFLIFIFIIYSFVMMRINSLRAAEPTAEQISSQVKASQTPRIDQKVVDQLKSLEDNSVSVKALFDEARQNPFQ